MSESSEAATVDDGLGDLNSIDLSILDYMSEVRPVISLLIEGGWGAGKTYYLNTRGARLAARQEKKLISFSAAGLQTREELEQALFFAASPLLGNGYIGALGVFARAGMRWIKIEPGEIKPKAELAPGKVVVAIDDAERFSGGYKVLFGFVIDLVDMNGIHVLLVAAEERAQKESSEFCDWKEKVVGRTVHLLPDPKFMVNTIISELADRVVAERILRHSMLLEEIVAAWGMANMRAAKHAIRDLARMVCALGSAFDRLGRGAEVLISSLLIGALEIRRDSKRVGEIAQLFSHADLGMAYQGHLLASADEEADTSALREVFERYERFPLGEFPGSKWVEQFLRSGVIDVKATLSSFERFGDEVSDRDVLLRDYRSMSQDVFEKASSELIDDVRHSRITSLGYLANVYISLRHLAEQRLIDLAPTEAKELCIHSIQNLDERKISDTAGDDDLFWYLQGIDSGHVEVQAAVAAKRASARDRLVDDRRSEFWRELGPGVEQLATKLQEWKATPLFLGEVGLLVAGLRSLSPLQMQDILRLLGSRRHIAGYEKSLSVERSVLYKVADELDRSVPPRGVLTIAQSHLGLLSSGIRAFADSLS